MHDDPAKLEIAAETGFVHDDQGRIVCINDPDRSKGPLLWMATRARANTFRLHVDVNPARAEQIAHLMNDEPPFAALGQRPIHMTQYQAILGTGEFRFELDFELPNNICPPPEYDLIRSGEPQGDELLERLASSGLPQGLLNLGFRNNIADIWSPWCIVRVDDEIASIAFASRLASRGAATGVATVHRFRGLGLAAVATAGFASHPALKDIVLGYSTALDNRSSQRVAKRLGLTLAGTSLTIG